MIDEPAVVQREISVLASIVADDFKLSFLRPAQALRLRASNDIFSVERADGKLVTEFLVVAPQSKRVFFELRPQLLDELRLLDFRRWLLSEERGNIVLEYMRE